MRTKKQEKKQPAGKLVIVLLILTALVFMMLGPRAKANTPQYTFSPTPTFQSSL